jgi:dimeric dUTPase (all-alpha-NTP-PPase superfamily)
MELHQEKNGRGKIVKKRNFTKLIDVQRGLMEKIEAAHPVKEKENRFYKRMLALLVEVGECANEWRGFKFWSNNQKPRLTVNCHSCDGYGMFDFGDKKEICRYCNGTGNKGYPLLEEYVDGLHFVLELGIILDVLFCFDEIQVYKSDSIEHQFIKLYREVTNLWLDEWFYLEVLNTFIGLGEMLGFTWEQIEAAYLEKNAVNHQRQKDGY